MLTVALRRKRAKTRLEKTPQTWPKLQKCSEVTELYLYAIFEFYSSLARGIADIFLAFCPHF